MNYSLLLWLLPWNSPPPPPVDPEFDRWLQKQSAGTDAEVDRLMKLPPKLDKKDK